VSSSAALDLLEKRVNLLSKAVNLLMFEEKERISRREALEIQRRLRDYLKGNETEFVKLEDIPDVNRKDTQKRSKRT
jgi:hypothetical protein